jgi:hypothetical protein
MNDARVNGEILPLASSNFNDVRRINCVHCTTSCNVRGSGCNALKATIPTPRDNFMGQVDDSVVFRQETNYQLYFTKHRAKNNNWNGG